MEKKKLTAKDRKILYGTIFVFFLMGSAIATQFCASLLDYQAALGAPLFFCGTMGIYAPWEFWLWYSKFGSEAPQIFSQSLSTFTFVVGIGVFTMIRLRKYLSPDERTSHGSARWGSAEEAKDEDLMSGKGVILGKLADKYLTDNGEKHVACVAPTGSGKGVGHIIPTLLNWQGSVVVLDVKGENYAKTAGFRKKVLKQPVLKLDVSRVDSIGFNFFEEIRRGPSEVKDTQNILTILVDIEGKGDLTHWQKAAKTLLVGIFLHLIYTKENPSIFDVLQFMFGEKPILEQLTDMTTTIHARTEEEMRYFATFYGVTDGIHPIIAQTALSMLSKPDKEFGSIVSTADEVLSVYRDPILAKNTRHSDFKIKDLVHYKKPISLYLICPPSDLDRLMPFFRLIIELLYRRLTEDIEQKKKEGAEESKIKVLRHRLLLMLDEFPMLGRMDNFEKILALLRGYGLKAYLICQSLEQLNKTYTTNNSIISNCHIRIFHTPNDLETPQYVSKMIGKKTIVVENKSYDSGFGSALGPKSTSKQETARELIQAEEVLKMPIDKEIIFVAGRPPFYADKIKYYEDRAFMERELEEPLSDSLYTTKNTINTINTIKPIKTTTQTEQEDYPFM